MLVVDAILLSLGREIDPMMKTLEEEYVNLNQGLRFMAINLPGFAFHKSLKVIKHYYHTLLINIYMSLSLILIN
jgi:hypothetical protein